MRHAGHVGLAAAIASAVPVAAGTARPEGAIAQDPNLLDGTLQAYFSSKQNCRFVWKAEALEVASASRAKQ